MVRKQQSGHNAEERCLARAIGSHKAKDFALLHLKADIAESLGGAIALANIGNV